ncbi:efflux RND transporter periplasmic adaptor subunit [Granulosicoccaceae sp. 1_MG-2023]|nr:efflux RND transporter periplasmic adaptor subunit [Granulosicoccaceae sp. 1_MG-2023]
MRTIKWVLALVIVVAAFLVARYIISHPPVAQAQRSETTGKPVPVETERLQRRDYNVRLSSYGTVAAARQITLVTQVSGKIITVSEEFADGAHVRAGQLLAQIDPADYRIAVKTAEATLAEARATLAEQAALSEQAITDWQRLGRRGEPGDLVAKKPQLDAARAHVASAQAQLERARLDLQRTEIRAPFDGRLAATQGDAGQYVSAGTTLATLYASGPLEVRLPLAQRERALIETGEHGSAVFFTDRETGKTIEGRLLRTEASVDSRTRQVFVIATVQDESLIIGQFLDAVIEGRRFSDVIPLDTRYLSEDGQLLLARDGKAVAVPVEVVWQDDRVALIGAGPADGELLITTPLGAQADGLAIQLRDDVPDAQAAPGALQ